MYHTPDLTMPASPAVLIIEDDPADAQLIRWQLLERSSHAFHVRIAHSLGEAEQLLEHDAFMPDVILLDLNLPDSSGVATVKHCRQRLPDKPIVVLTGLADEDAIQGAIGNGAEDYLAKGADGSSLRKAIRYAMLRHNREADARLAATVFTHTREGIMITAPDGSIIEVNDAFSRITGYSRDEVVGRNPKLLQSGHHDEAFYSVMWRTLQAQGRWQGEIWNRHKDGSLYAELLTITAVYDKRGAVGHYVALFTDITLQKEQQRHLEKLAHFDALTGLPNRVLLGDRLEQAMHYCQHHPHSGLAVVYIDIDGFKAINDRYGHDVGDIMLKTLSQRLRQGLRDSDTLGRLGGDEFVALLLEISQREDVLQVLERLLAAAARPVLWQGQTLQVSASCGVSFYPQTDITYNIEADQLLRQADQAMYQAKLLGKHRFHFFDAQQDQQARLLHARLERLRQALRDNEFHLHYQPKANMRSGEVVGWEALLRWQREGVLLSPAAFAIAFEDASIAWPLDRWVLRRALRQVRDWQEQGYQTAISINISAHSLQHSEFYHHLAQVLQRYAEVDPSQITLEIVESSALEDIDAASQMMRRCQELGVGFALDDFGTGYSSLTYLKNLPVRELKADQSFVRDMLDDPEDLAILRGVQGLASAFRRSLTAEGVESIAHGRYLLQLGYEIAQGYAIAKPMPASEVLAWLEQWSPEAHWLQQQAIGDDHLPLLFAEVEHRAWVKGIESFVLQRSSHYPTLDSQSCYFGHWLRNQSHSYLQEAPHKLEQLNRLHEVIHETANRMVSQCHQGDCQNAAKQLSTLYQLRDSLIAIVQSYLNETIVALAS